MSLRSTWISAASGEKTTIGGKVLILSLLPLSWLYRAGLAIYLQCEKIGFRKRTKLPIRVVSVGNLTMGGTGKTGVVETLARTLKQEIETAILLRGYGGAKSREGLIVSDGSRIRADWEDSGDEAALLAHALPGVRVVVGKDRRVTGQWAVNDLQARLVILDDGLQYWQLSRDVDIVLVDTRNPFGNGQVMPAGMLREPISGLRRAQVVILTHYHEAPKSRRTIVAQRMQKINPAATLHFADYAPVGLERTTGELEDSELLRGKRVLSFCAIGSPCGFTATLEDAGAQVVAELFLPDHHPISQEDVDRAMAWAERAGAEMVIATSKDWVKMKRLRIPDSFLALRVEMMISDLDSLSSLVMGRTL
ncbi:MAG: tetraacyldisaccharide 4'-kinase [Armatimonadota bacterium]